MADEPVKPSAASIAAKAMVDTLVKCQPTWMPVQSISEVVQREDLSEFTFTMAGSGARYLVAVTKVTQH
jgi:hypothetical protein